DRELRAMHLRRWRSGTPKSGGPACGALEGGLERLLVQGQFRLQGRNHLAAPVRRKARFIDAGGKGTWDEPSDARPGGHDALLRGCDVGGRSAAWDTDVLRDRLPSGGDYQERR